MAPAHDVSKCGDKSEPGESPALTSSTIMKLRRHGLLDLQRNEGLADERHEISSIFTNDGIPIRASANYQEALWLGLNLGVKSNR